MIRTTPRLLLVFALLACLTLSALSGRSLAHSPAAFLEVIDGKSTSTIQHGVEVETALDAGRGMVDLIGPKRFARGVQGMGRSGAPPKAFMNWYEIESPKPAAKKTVSILDPFRGDSKTPLALGTADYLLCPTQVIASGPPAPIPHGMDFLKAYKILDGKPVTAKVTVGTGDAKQERIVGKPVYACIPAKHWHHEEFADVTHPTQCYVVYEINKIDVDETISMMDQFGLNQFKADSTQWLCVTGSLLDAK